MRKIIKIKLYDDEQIFKVNLSEIIFFIIKNNGSMPFLFETHFSKKCLYYAGDTNFDFVDFNFDFGLFINSIRKILRILKKKFLN